MPEKIGFHRYWSQRIIREVSPRQEQINGRSGEENYTKISLLRAANDMPTDYWFYLSWYAQDAQFGVSDRRELFVRAKDLMVGLNQLRWIQSRVKSQIIQHGELLLKDDYGKTTTSNHLREIPDTVEVWHLAHFPVTRYDFNQHLELFEKAREEYDKMSLEAKQNANSV